MTATYCQPLPWQQVKLLPATTPLYRGGSGSDRGSESWERRVRDGPHKRDDEDDDAVIQRLLGVSELAGVDPSRNKRFYVCAAAAELKKLNFTFYKDEDDDEPEEHYSVDLGQDPTVDDVVRFLRPFGPPEGKHR